MAQKWDPQSDGLHQSENGGISNKTRVDFPKVNSTRSNLNNYLRESSVDSCESDEWYDTIMFHAMKMYENHVSREQMQSGPLR